MPNFAESLVTAFTHSAARAGVPRDPEADRAILQATIELLGEHGYEGMSIEAVAARAGVGKTTVYRRWISKEPLVVDAVERYRSPETPAPPREGESTRDALVRVLAHFTRVPVLRYRAGWWPGSSRRCHATPSSRVVRAGILERRRSRVFAILKRGIEL